jgi:EmrB/QacA subfamily drug resistance transporter
MERKWWTLAAVSTGVFMLLLDLTIVNVALPDIQQAFNASLSDLQWTIDAYALTLAAFLLTAGSLADLYGRRILFAGGLAVFTVGSLACGLANDSLFLVVARAAQGVGGAIMFATSLALIAEAFRGRERAIAFALLGGITGIAVAIGPVLGGVLTSSLSWRWIFFVNLPIGVLAFLVTVTRVDESRNPFAKRLDIAGFLTFSTGLAALTFGLIRSNEDGWSSATVVGSLVGAAVLLAAFVLVERVQREPMFDLGLLRVPTFDGGLVAALAVNGSLFALLTYLILYFQQSLGMSAAETGVRLLPLTIAIFFAAGIAGRLSDRVPTRWLIAPGFVLIGVGLLLMRGLEVGSSWTHFLAGMIVAGIGAGFVNVPLAATAIGVVEPARAGMASGINTTFRQVGTATGVAVLGAVFAGHLRSTAESDLGTGPLADRAGEIAHAIGAGGMTQTLGRLPASLRPDVVHAGQAGFVDGLNLILLVGAGIALAAAIATLALIRDRDFVDSIEDEADAELELQPSRAAA